jgi:hypothetical protein
MTKDKKIPQADIRRDTRVSKPRNPETIRLPDDEGLVKDENARARPTGVFVSRPNQATPQQSYESGNVGPLSKGSFFDIPPKNITDSRVPDFSVNNPLFESPPRTVISVIDDGVPVISDVDETRFETQEQEDALRRRAPPPVSFNPGSFATEPNQIPSAPGIRNLPREWQNLPENFQSQLRRLLPIYYDITGPFSNLVDVPAYVPPPLFDTTPTFEGETGEEGFIKNETEDVAPMEPPNRSNIDFLNLLNFLFNLILSADSDIYEVVSFTRIEEGGASSPDVPVAGGEAPDAAPGPEAETPGRFTQETREFPDGSRRRVVLENGEVVATLSADRVPPPQNEIPSRPFLSSPVVGDGLV